MEITLKHPQSGLLKNCTVWFFNGPLVLPTMILNGMWKQLFISFITCGVALLYYTFTVDKIHVTNLMERGYMPATDADHQKLVKLGLIAPKPANDKAA